MNVSVDFLITAGVAAVISLGALVLRHRRLDEITLTGPTTIHEIRDGEVTEWRVNMRVTFVVD